MKPVINGNLVHRIAQNVMADRGMAGARQDWCDRFAQDVVVAIETWHLFPRTEQPDEVVTAERQAAFWPDGQPAS